MKPCVNIGVGVTEERIIVGAGTDVLQATMNSQIRLVRNNLKAPGDFIKSPWLVNVYDRI